MSDVAIENAKEAEIIKEWLRDPTYEETLESYIEDYRLQGMSSKEIKERTTAVIDYATGEETTFKACKDKYGEEIAKDILRDKKGTKELEPDVIQQIEDIHNRSLSVKKTEKEASQIGKKITKKTKRNELFVQLPFELIGNQEFRVFFKRSYLTYAFLRSYIIREPASFDKLNIYENYFLKGKLASSWSIRKLAEYLGCSPTTIREQLREMKDKGCFKVDPVPAQKAWDGQQHKIYVFGTHDGNKNETYYIDKAFEMPEVPEDQLVQ